MQDKSAAPVAPGHAGFWRRLGAFAIDALLIGIAGYLLGLVFGEAFARAGAWGRLIGFLLAGAWFVPHECAWGGGRTPGKRLLGLRVVDARGQAPGPLRAAARYAIFAVPYFLNGAHLPASLLFGPGVYLVSLLVFGIGGISLYLFVFDRRSRSALHDRWTRTAVVRAAALPAPFAAPQLRPGHRLAAAAVLVFAFAAPLAVRQLVKSGPLADIERLYASVSAQPGVRFAGVSDTTQTRYGLGGSALERVVTVTAVIDGDVSEPGALPEELARRVFESLPDAASADFIAIRLSHGFDIGIASRFTDNDLVRAPEQWRDRIAAGAQG
jgi:uncharacterized RDD family membrane protein YckC